MIFHPPFLRTFPLTISGDTLHDIIIIVVIIIIIIIIRMVLKRKHKLWKKKKMNSKGFFQKINLVHLIYVTYLQRSNMSASTIHHTMPTTTPDAPAPTATSIVIVAISIQMG